MLEELKTLFPGKENCLLEGVITARENNKCFRIICDDSLRANIVKVQVDGCLISDQNVKKCDWLFVIEDSKGLIFVECKGNNVLHAISQIRNTLKLTKPIIELSLKRLAVVIPSKVAPALNTTIQTEMKKLKHEYGITLFIKNRECKISLPNFSCA